MIEIIGEIEKDPASFSKIVLSAPGKKDPSLPEKVLLQKKLGKDGSAFFTGEEIIGTKAFHKNLSPDEVSSYVNQSLEKSQFRQANLFRDREEIAFRISKKGKISKSRNQNVTAPPAVLSHNREKNYLVRPGDRVPFMVDLGIFTQDYQVVSQKYDKFRQINRFVEILDHTFSDFNQPEISVLDFGCGKSYLTFLVYYYFAVLKKKKVHIIGYDLKEDVVNRCNQLAKKYGYHGLGFVVADVTKDPLSQEKIDFVISLHACDVATDFALQFAMERDVPYIFSVPCCQHEINASIGKGGGDLDIFMGHGIFKERVSALLTDAFRAEILECEGYRVEVLEFVDFAHSPKNLMLRAKKKERFAKKSLDHLCRMEERYGFQQTLLHLRLEK